MHKKQVVGIKQQDEMQIQTDMFDKASFVYRGNVANGAWVCVTKWD